MPAGQQEHLQQDLRRVHHAAGLRAGLGKLLRLLQVEANSSSHGRHPLSDSSRSWSNALLQLAGLLHSGQLRPGPSLSGGVGPSDRQDGDLQCLPFHIPLGPAPSNDYP